MKARRLLGLFGAGVPRWLVMACLAVFAVSANADTNIALNASPLESDAGWGGGSYPWEIVDGQRTYSGWAHGLAFTGGSWQPSVAGPRQATINFGATKTFHKVIIWHHGHDHAPAQAALAYWNGTNWVDIAFQRTFGAIEAGGAGSTSDEYSFAPVTGSKVRWSFDNRLASMAGIQIVHGWIYEFEVFGSSCSIGPLATQHMATPSYDESCLDPALEGALLCFESVVLASGGHISKNSACRSTPYQTHLYDVWTKFDELANVNGIVDYTNGRLRQLATTPGTVACQELVDQVNQEVRWHFPSNWPAVVARPGTSPHEFGRAVDWSVSLPTGISVDQIAGNCGLRRPLLHSHPPETWHFELMNVQPRRRVTVTAHSPVNILVQDPNGRRIGYDPSLNATVNQIGSAASYSGLGSTPQIIEILPDGVVPGQYRVSGVGTGTGGYTVTMRIVTEDDSGDVLEEMISTGFAQPSQPLAPIAPVDVIQSIVPLGSDRLGQGLILLAPAWALNAVVEFSTNLAAGSWSIHPETIDPTSGLVLPSLSERQMFFRLRTGLGTSGAALGLSMAGPLAPVAVGSSFTNTILVANFGPTEASNVVLTNRLPAEATFVTATSSQGQCSFASGVVTCDLENLRVGSNAVITIVASPTAGGLVTNVAGVFASQVDPNVDDNTGSVVTKVNTTISINDPMVMEGNGGTNSLAFEVRLGALSGLPVSVSYSTANGSATAGTDYLATSGTVLFAPGETVTNILIPVIGDTQIESNEIFLVNLFNPTNATIVMAQGTGTILTDDFMPVVVAAGAVLVSEGCIPTNGVIDPGEGVTVTLSLQNVGNVDTTNLIATLLPTVGVTVPTGPVNYGSLIAGGIPIANAFSLVATGLCGGTLTATLQLQDGTNDLGTTSFSFVLGSPATMAVSFTNSSAISIPDSGAGNPYPSSITVSGLTVPVTNSTVTLNGLSHTYPSDLEILLVGPAGQSVLLMSYAGGSGDILNVTLTFDDLAPGSLPGSSQITSGRYRPASSGFDDLPPPAPTSPYGANLAVFNASNPNGEWKLFVYDDAGGDQGILAGGWSLTLNGVTYVCCGN